MLKAARELSNPVKGVAITKRCRIRAASPARGKSFRCIQFLPDSRISTAQLSLALAVLVLEAFGGSMLVQGLEKCAPDDEPVETRPHSHHSSSGKVVSMERTQAAPKETLTAALDAALRSADPELDQILSALEEISVGLKSGTWKHRDLENALQRAASCALRQSLMDREIRNLAVTDELTGLYNRRGFRTAATQQLKLAHRQGEEALLLFCDLDGLKQINDSFGHREGDLALIRASEALQRTFRDSD